MCQFIKKSDKQSSTTGKPGYVQDTGYYAELETEKDSIINVWITSIMLAQSKNYDLSSNNVYIVPFGKKISQESGYEYNSFVIFFNWNTTKTNYIKDWTGILQR